MKTQTRSQLIDFIKKNGKTRPSDLTKILQITPQALHRHLRSLVGAGVLTVKGRPPLTYYDLAGVADFSLALSWYKADQIQSNSDFSLVCETRDIFTARLSSLKALVKQGLQKEFLSPLLAAVGEIGNNSFDHNLGHWKDVPGCWFENQTTGTKLWICIGDRGQGIYRSLVRVDPTISNDQEAIETAFEKQISGRAPEKRGNGLKYVKNIILGGKNRGLACRSGQGLVHFGEWGIECSDILKNKFPKTYGTFTLLNWELNK